MRKIIAFGFLSLLLSAWGFKTVHVLVEHGHEKACFETKAHFHEAEHNCFICDFNFQPIDDFVVTNQFLTLFYTHAKKYFVYLGNHCVKSVISFDSRGPPSALYFS